MKRFSYRGRRNRLSFSPEGNVPTMEKKDQKFFGAAAGDTFFQPAASLSRSAEPDEQPIHRSADEKEEQKQKEKLKEKEREREKDKRLHRSAGKDDKEEKKEEKIHKKSAGGRAIAGKRTADYVGSIAGKGQQLSAKDQSFFQKKMGRDFSSVRVHTGKDAAESASDIGARAYTYGSNVVFNEGQYSTESHEGRTLLAHELAHVVQQDAAPEQDHGSEQSLNETRASTLLSRD